MIWEGAITTEEEIYNFPESRDEVKVYTDADITIAFWQNKIGAYGEEIEVLSPGQFVAVCGSRGRVTGTANVVIL